MAQYRASALVATLVAAMYLAGWLDLAERSLLDARSGFGSRPASGDLVLVAIDSASLGSLAQWPWPRRYHGEVIARLIGAGARQIAYDVVFSSASQPDDDAALANALAAAGPDRVALPVFRQLRQTNDQRIEPVDTAPLAVFREHVSPASINVQPDPDGLVRRVRGAAEWAGRTVPTMPAWLVGDAAAADHEVLLDFGIDVRSIPRLSFADVLDGEFDPAVIAGRRVLVGAVAIELGDWIGVPRYRALPGPMVQALAFETLVQGRALHAIQGWPVALAAGALTLVVGVLFGRLAWRRALALLASLVIVITALAVGLQELAAIALDTSAALLGALLAFGVATLGRVERQARALVGQIGSLPAKDDMMRQLVDNSFDAIITFGAGDVVLSYNQAAERIFGVPGAIMTGRSVAALLPDHRHGSFAALARSGGTHELEAVHASGARVPLEATFSRMTVDEKWVGIAILRDITERKAQQAELERMALHDALTGLPNRTLLNDRVELAIRSAQRSNLPMAVLLLDLDRFKDVNDTLGHHVGDLLLIEVGPRLQQPLRAADTVARLGGDEFAILLPGPTDLETACQVAERIVEALRRPFAIRDLVLEVGVSIGVAIHPDHGTSAQELLQHADVAMYAAKRGQLGFAVYRADSDGNSVRQLTLTGELRRAIEEGQMVLEFQPKVDARTDGLAGVEALIRWHHPEHGAIPPDDFIHSAEQTGLIRPLTLWVMNAALAALGGWTEDGHDFGVAVNLSVKSLQDPELPSIVHDLLQSWGQRPERLTFEITESALMADPATALAVLEGIAALGCRLSLDDFGTGYSSLAYLQKLPIDELKIDRSFVVAMNHDENAAVIVRSVVQLAKGLGLSVVAEGVESEAAYDRLRSLGCDQVQGYLFGPSMADDRFRDWLERSPWGPRARHRRAPVPTA